MTAPRTWRMSCARLEGLLISARERAGLKQAQVAKRVGVSLSTFKRWELGRAEPRLRDLFRWADAVGVSIDATLAVQGVSSDTCRSADHGLADPVQGENATGATSCHVETPREIPHAGGGSKITLEHLIQASCPDDFQLELWAEQISLLRDRASFARRFEVADQGALS